MKIEQQDNRWLDEIREQIQDFEAPLPADGWERLSSSLVQAEKPKFTTRWMSLAASALLCVMIGGGYYFLVDKPDIVTEQQEITEPQKVQEPLITNNLQTEKPEQQPTTYLKPSTKGRQTSKNVPISDETTSPKETVIATLQTEEETPVLSDTILPFFNQEEEEVLLAMTITDSKASANADWSFGLHLGGHGSLLDSELTTNPGYTSDPTYNGTPETNEPVATDDVTASNHHTSWSFGLSVGHQLSPKTTLETGLVYTLLTSDVEMKFSGIKEQRIQYLGVPLKLNYQILGDERLQLYASGGLMLEHSLSAKRGQAKLDVKPWQWSTNLSAGGQLRVTDNLYLFLEPGVSWYFDADTSAPSLRSESPVYFNLKGGLRIAY